MNDPIEREDAIRMAQRLVFETAESALDKDALDLWVKEQMKAIPSARPKYGTWKAKSFHEVYCDNCGFTFDIMKCDFLENMKFCPNCSADMRRERSGTDKDKFEQ